MMKFARLILLYICLLALFCGCTVPASEEPAPTQVITFPTETMSIPEETIPQPVAPLYCDNATFEQEVYQVPAGTSKQLTLMTEPDMEVLWESSDPTVIKVDQQGTVTALRDGSVIITATGQTVEFSASCKVNVCKAKQIALTFDDGPAGSTAELLDFLKDHHIKVTFFMVGNRMSAYSSTVARMAADGHELGYHSYSHQNQCHLSSGKIRADYDAANKKLFDITGKEFTVWRTPGGNYNQSVLDAVPVPHIMWSVDTLDWKTRDSAAVHSAIVNGAQDGAIILLHDLHPTTVAGAISAIEELMATGEYDFVTVTELLSREGESPMPHRTYTNG